MSWPGSDDENRTQELEGFSKPAVPVKLFGSFEGGAYFVEEPMPLVDFVLADA